jgi:sigma54-dependent transcription regulator
VAHVEPKTAFEVRRFAQRLGLVVQFGVEGDHAFIGFSQFAIEFGNFAFAIQQQLKQVVIVLRQTFARRLADLRMAV